MSYVYTFGFIGCGNMGGALAKAIAKGGCSANDNGHKFLLLADRDMEKAKALANDLNAAVGSVSEVAELCRYVFLGVKPQMMAEMLASIQSVLAKRANDFVLVSMAAGMSIARIRELAGGNAYPVIRIMPNTPARVGAGMILYAAGNVSKEAKADFTAAMAGAGLLDELDEELIDAGSAVSGCGPAFVDLFLEALADGGVECGLPRDKAQQYAAQMVLGSARLLLENGDHPGVLKDQVCSPGGSTIAGVHALERSAFRAAVMDAVTAAYEKTKALG